MYERRFDGPLRWRIRAGFGYARITDLEPGMVYRREPGGGPLTFDHLDSAGVHSGHRWVLVTTTAGLQYLCEWDSLVQLEE